MPKPGGTLRSVVVLILLVAALAGLLVQYQRMRTEPPAPVPAALPAVSAANATDQDNATNATDQDNASVAVPLPEPASPALPGPEPLRPTAPAAAAPSLPAPTTSFEVSRKAPESAPAEPARTPRMQTLTITAKGREVCWVGVYEGAKGTSFTLRNGESRQVEFAKRASLRLGNAGGVTVQLNGQDYPFEGDRGQKVTLEFGTR